MAVPKLRFKANDESEFPEWEEKTIGEIATKVDRKANEGSTAPVMMISQGNGFIFQSEKYSRENSGQSLKKYTLLQNGEMAYNHGASKACPYGVTYPLVEVAEARVPFVYHCFSLASKENQGFWKLALNSSNVNRQLKKMVSSSVRDDGLLNISFDTYMDTKVWYPSLPEQKKIADCMFILDTVIANCQSEADVWEKYKRGVMQQLFSQKVRFKADDGSEYTDWEEKKLGDIGIIITGTTPSTKIEEYYKYGKYLWVTPTDINKGKEIKNTEKKLSEAGLKKGRVVDKNSVLVTCIASIGKNCILREKGSCNQQINAIKPSDSYNVDFVYYRIETLKNKMALYAGMTATTILNKSNFEKMTTLFPCLEEQQKIAECLSAFDEVIDKAKQKLEAYKRLKKGLLQQMLV